MALSMQGMENKARDHDNWTVKLLLGQIDSQYPAWSRVPKEKKKTLYFFNCNSHPPKFNIL